MFNKFFIDNYIKYVYNGINCKDSIWGEFL